MNESNENTSVCLLCGSGNITRFTGRTETFGEGRFTSVVENLSGMDCNNCGEGFYEGSAGDRESSMGRVMEAHDKRIYAKRKEAVRYSEEIIERLGLTEDTAVMIFARGSAERMGMWRSREIPIAEDLFQRLVELHGTPDLDVGQLRAGLVGFKVL